MKLVVFIRNQGQVTLTDNHYVAAGGEASIYKVGNTAFKIYHDPKKMIAIKKIEELNKISNTNVLKPKDIIQDKKTPIGYTMDFIENTHPICKLFTKSFKETNGLNPDDIVKIIKDMQLTIRDIHKDKLLVVDLNELNLLLSNDFKKTYFIDVDSYQTESFKATAIMESIRDRLVKNNDWTEFSDWFSFAVIAFQMYIGIHPYKGNHPNYKINEWSKRMDDGISVFEKDVSVPKVCNSFSIIPENHLKWMQNVFIRNERSIPPLPDETIVVIAVPKIVFGDIKDFDVKLMSEYPDNIRFVYIVSGTKYVVTTKELYKEDKNILKTNSRVFVCDSGNANKPVICKQEGHELKFSEISGKSFPQVNSIDSMCKNNCIYSLCNDKMIELSFREIGGNIVTSARNTCNISSLSTKMYDGVVFQDLLGKKHISLPYEQGKCLFIHIPELDKCRILEAKADKNICVVVGEESGKYVRYIFVFNDKFAEYDVRKNEDVTYAPVNFAVKDNGVCIMAIDGDLEIFYKNQIKTIKGSQIDADMKLLNINGEICFVDENKIYSLKSK